MAIDALDIEAFADLARALRAEGVTEFRCGDVYLRLDGRAEGLHTPAPRAEHPPEPRDLRSTAQRQGIGPLRFPGAAE